MNGKINNTLLTTLRPTAAAIEVNDSDLKGFGLRIQPSGVMSYFVRYRLRGKQTRYVIGRTSEFTPAQARDVARSTLAGVNLGTNPLDDRKPLKEAKTLGKCRSDFDLVTPRPRGRQPTFSLLDGRRMDSNRPVVQGR